MADLSFRDLTILGSMIGVGFFLLQIFDWAVSRTRSVQDALKQKAHDQALREHALKLDSVISFWEAKDADGFPRAYFPRASVERRLDELITLQRETHTQLQELVLLGKAESRNRPIS
jgi:hypothetical protein